MSTALKKKNVTFSRWSSIYPNICIRTSQFNSLSIGIPTSSYFSPLCNTTAVMCSITNLPSLPIPRSIYFFPSHWPPLPAITDFFFLPHHLSFPTPSPLATASRSLLTASTHFHHSSSSISARLSILLSIQPPENTTRSGSGRSSLITNKENPFGAAVCCF